MNTQAAASASSRWPTLPARLPLWASLLPAAAILLVGFVFPLARLVLDSLTVEGGLALDRYAELSQSPVFARIVLRTLRVAAITTVICVILGYPLAYALAKLPARFAAILLLAVLVPYFTSTLIRSYAWVVILADNGLLNVWLQGLGLIEAPVRLAFTELGTQIGLVQIGLPLVVLPIYSVMRGIDRSLVMAARSLGARPASAFWHVFLPLSVPGVTAGASLVFVTTLGAFITPALLGAPGEYYIAQSIEARVNGAGDFGDAAAQASVLLTVVLLVMFVLRRQLGMALPASPATPFKRSAPRPFGRLSALLEPAGRIGGAVTASISSFFTLIRYPAVAAIAAISLVYLVGPMVVVIILAFSDGSYLSFPPPGFSLRWFESYLANPLWRDATVFSLVVSSGAALISCGVGTIAAFPLVRSDGRLASGAYLFLLAPLILPPMIFAIAMFFLLASIGLIATPIAFVVAYVVLGLPFAVVVMTAALRRFDRSLEQAAASLGASPVRILWTITLPLLRPAIVTAFLFAFLVAFDDVIVAIFLGGPGALTLPILMWSDVLNQVSPRIAAVGTLFFMVAVALVALAELARRAIRWQHGG